MESKYIGQFSEAQYQVQIGNFESAQIILNKLQSETKSYELFITRAIVNQKLNNIEQSQQDTDNAILLDRHRWEGFFYKAQNLFLQGNFKSALIEFENSQEKAKDINAKKRLDIQIAKCNAELKSQVLTLQQQSIQIIDVEDQSKGKSDKKIAPSSSEKKIKFQWYQTMGKVGIEIEYGLQNKNLLKQNFTEQTVHISFPVSDSQEYQLNLNLFDTINPANTKVNVYLNKIEIVLEKAHKEKSWHKLEAAETENQAGSQINEGTITEPAGGSKNVKVEEVKPFYPSSNKIKKDWSKIDQEIEHDMNKNREEYGVDPLNSLFQQIYQNSDENTRKAMVKSMQTSGGTVLSTNWDEVKQKEYDGKDRPDAPTGQEWQKWGK